MFPAKVLSDTIEIETQDEDISTNNENEIMYNLCSVVHHKPSKCGKSKDTKGVEGHFTAAVKVDDNWISVDDEKLEKIDAINGSTTRILFYRRIEQEDK
jgi:ubiquitin C-terminal hydrolase